MFDKIRLPAGSPLRDAVTLINPLGEDTSVMRTTLLPSVLEALARNSNYHNTADCGLFENASIYLKKGENELPDEPWQIVAAMYGQDVDFYRIKGICEAVFADVGITGARYTAVTDDPTWHPGRCAVASHSGRDARNTGRAAPGGKTKITGSTRPYTPPCSTLRRSSGTALRSAAMCRCPNIRL